ncbi:MAG: hypothetical protein OSA98_23970 [Rubripirellula sp.]|nr:hypothetical protein [Rubripirellula sp.]
MRFAVANALARSGTEMPMPAQSNQAKADKTLQSLNLHGKNIYRVAR